MKTFIIATVLLLLGCQTRAERPWLLDQFSSYGYMVNHHEVFAFATLKDEAQRKSVIAELDRSLSERQPLPHYEKNVVRDRDFWALVLSDLTRGLLAINTWDTIAAREGKIEAFLEKLHR
jgi:hypothetical protein